MDAKGLRKYAEEAVNNMGDVFYDADSFSDPEKTNENIYESAVEEVFKILVKAIERHSERIEIQTPAGTIRASKQTDPNYPGVAIGIVDEEGIIDNAALVEYRKEDGKIMTYGWSQSNEDPSFIITSLESN